MIIRFLVIGFLLLLGLSFYFQNQDQVITIRYFFGFQERTTPMFVPVFFAFLLGLLMTSLLLVPGWVKTHLALRRKTKALLEAESDLGRLSRSLEKAATTHQTPDSLVLSERPRND